ncbi:MAG: DUF2182 domain-containing protein [Proteobacteria bacterium]|nr:DUF2182 domain-containing protein [Pseudomonadota bacterium]
MPEARVLERALARPRRAMAGALLLVTALAWWQLQALGAHGAAHLGSPAVHLGRSAWHGGDWLRTLAMWLLMVLAMMLPTAAPAVLAFGDLAARAGPHGHRRSLAFIAGYLAAWATFGVLATAAQGVFAALVLRSPPALGPSLTGALLLAAGLYQFSAAKQACLEKCRSPMAFFLAHWREGASGAAALGLRHGAYCVGCCWLLMALMLPSGAMTPAVTALLGTLMLAEKVVPGGQRVAHAAGALLGGLGATLITVTWI